MPVPSLLLVSSLIVLATIFDPEYNHDVVYYSSVINEQNGFGGGYDETRRFLEDRMSKEKLDEFDADNRYPKSPEYFRSVIPF